MDFPYDDTDIQCNYRTVRDNDFNSNNSFTPISWSSVLKAIYVNSMRIFRYLSISLPENNWQILKVMRWQLHIRGQPRRKWYQWWREGTWQSPGTNNATKTDGMVMVAEAISVSTHSIAASPVISEHAPIHSILRTAQLHHSTRPNLRDTMIATAKYPVKIPQRVEVEVIKICRNLLHRGLLMWHMLPFIYAQIIDDASIIEWTEYPTFLSISDHHTPFSETKWISSRAVLISD